MAEEKDLQAAAGEQVERLRDKVKNYSDQPRFEPGVAGGDATESFMASLPWVADSADQIPPYVANSRDRDAWLSKFWRKEPHLQGVIDSVVAINKNRRWTLTGGRNQVSRFSDIFHGWRSAPGLVGWRGGISSAALSYYTTDIGAIVEVGREGKNGPMRGLYHVDPTRCVLTGDERYPLRYYPRTGKMQKWGHSDFMRAVALPSIVEEMNGLGNCALSRVVELTEIMIAVYRHDLESLAARAPRGLMLIRGIGQAQWEEAMKARTAALDGDGYKYFQAVAVLASGAAEIDAKLVALSQLPANFDRKTVIDLLMYAYALCFGYDPAEFWPVQFGSLGRGTEGTLQAEKATGKGGLDFVLTFQEQLQDFIPETLQFEFDQRDDKWDAVQAEIQLAWGKVAESLYAVGATTEQAFAYLAEHDVIPEDWTEAIEDAEASDTEDVEDTEDEMEVGAKNPGREDDDEPAVPNDEAPIPEDNLRGRGVLRPKKRVRLTQSALKRERDRVRDMPFVQRAARDFPGDAIVKYEWPTNREIILWESGGELLRPSLWSVNRTRRAEGGATLYSRGDIEITEGDVDRAIDEAGRRVGGDMRDALSSEPVE